MKVCIRYVILKTFSLGFPKRVKAVASVLTVREETYTYETTGGNFNAEYKEFILCREAAHKWWRCVLTENSSIPIVEVSSFIQ